MRRRGDVTPLVIVAAALMTSCCWRLTNGRPVPDTVYYEMDEKLDSGTPLGQGLIADAGLSSVYSEEELGRLQFSLVRGLPPDIVSQYFTIDQRTGFIRVS